MKGYSAVDVEKFDAAVLLPQLTMGCIVAIDVAKTWFVAAIATAAGEVVKLIKFEHPRQTGRSCRCFGCLAKADKNRAW